MKGVLRHLPAISADNCRKPPLLPVVHPFALLALRESRWFTCNAENPGLDWPPDLLAERLVPGGTLAATQTAKAPKRRAKQSKANGAGRTATGQPPAANGSGVELHSGALRGGEADPGASVGARMARHHINAG